MIAGLGRDTDGLLVISAKLVTYSPIFARLSVCFYVGRISWKVSK